MANQPPAGRWMRMATLRPMQNPNQDPQPPAPRPVLGRAFTAVPFRPAVPTVPTPVAAVPPALVGAPPPARQVTPTPPAVTAIRPSSLRQAAGTNGIPPPQGAPNTTSVTNGAPSPQRAPSPAPAAVTNGVPSPKQAPNAVTTNGIPSPQRAPITAAANTVPSPQLAPNATATIGGQTPEQPKASSDLMPNFAPSPQPAPSPPKPQLEPTASPVQQKQTMFAGNGVQQHPSSPQVNAQLAPSTTRTTNTPSPISKAPYAQNFVMPRSPSQKSPQQPSGGYSSPKQGATVTTITSPPAPRVVKFSSIQTFESPAKSQTSPATSTPRIPSPAISPYNKSSPPVHTPPQSPKTMSMAHPPSPLHLPPPQLSSDAERNHNIPKEPEQKTILFLQTPEKHKSSNSFIKPHSDQKSSQFTKHENDTKSTAKEHKKHSDPVDIGRSIITIAGENRGAVMELGRPRTTHPQFPGNPHKLTNPSSKLSDSESDQSSGNKGNPKRKDAISAAMKSFMNSNVQGINNSIMFNSTVAQHDPGVHVGLSRKKKGHAGLIRQSEE